MREYESLIGRRFGKLVVKELLPSDGTGHRRWLCACDCGKTHTVTTGNLNSGAVTNCGCSRSPDLSGQVFGHLTVLRQAEGRILRGNQKRIAWECRCDCGNLVRRTSASLISTKERMCSECARKNSAKRATESAGFEQGTQIPKITEMKLTAANTSGCRGVYYRKNTDTWEARLKFRGKLMSFGTYRNYEDAVKARKRAEEEIFGAFLTEREQKEQDKNAIISLGGDTAV